jgi:hypothetical protein
LTGRLDDIPLEPSNHTQNVERIFGAEVAVAFVACGIAARVDR